MNRRFRAASSALSASLGAWLAACASAPPTFGEQPFAPPRVVRRDGRIDERLWPRGELGAAPAPTLAEALARAESGRTAGAVSGGVFVVLREKDGWRAWSYSSPRVRRARLAEIDTAGLPLAADPDAPLTFLVDSEGAVGRLTADGDEFAIVRVPRGSLGEPAPARPVVTGFVAPAAMSNQAGNVRWTPRYVFRPGSSLDALSAGLRWASAHLDPTLPIRAVGSRHSWSPVAAASGVTVLPDDCVGVEEVAGATRESGPLMRILAGTTIGEVNRRLAERGLAIPYLGGYDGQTVGGVLATGTHGSVGALGPLADLIRGVDLVRFDGGVMRIEPARRAATAPASSAPSSGEAIEARADDDLFDAVRLGFGAFGVLHSLVLETVPKYWLEEARTVVSFEEVRERMRGERLRALFVPRDAVLARLRAPALGDASTGGRPASGLGFAGHPAPAFHLELLWNPYGDGKTLVTTRHWVDDATRARFEAEEPRDFTSAPRRDLFRFLDPKSASSTRPGLSELLAKRVGVTATELVELLQRDSPRSVPNLVDASIEALVNRETYVRRSYDVFNIGDATNRLPSLSATISVPVRDDLWLRAVDVMHRTSEDLLHREGIVQTAPTSLRFVAASRALLGDPEDVCKFEIIFGGVGATARRHADRLVAAHFEALRAELGDVVRLHFGQLIPPGTLDRPDAQGRLPVETAFPKYGVWRRLRDELDPGGRGLTPWLRTILPEAR